jgi:hypothetical protein
MYKISPGPTRIRRPSYDIARVNKNARVVMTAGGMIDAPIGALVRGTPVYNDVS